METVPVQVVADYEAMSAEAARRVTEAVAAKPDLVLALPTGGTPLGAPLIGWVGDAWGPRWTLLVGAIATGAAALLAGAYLWNRMGRPTHRVDF